MTKIDETVARLVALSNAVAYAASTFDAGIASTKTLTTAKNKFEAALRAELSATAVQGEMLQRHNDYMAGR